MQSVPQWLIENKSTSAQLLVWAEKATTGFGIFYVIVVSNSNTESSMYFNQRSC